VGGGVWASNNRRSQRLPLTLTLSPQKRGEGMPQLNTITPRATAPCVSSLKPSLISSNL
jgi:hypothetical protein